MNSDICSGTFFGGELEPGTFHCGWNPTVEYIEPDADDGVNDVAPAECQH